MTITLDGSLGVTAPTYGGTVPAEYHVPVMNMKSRIFDGGFTINQRGYVSGTSLSAGTYAHDRWKAGASGCTYTFTQGALGVPTTITITAGSLIQVIEGCNLPEGGTYVLSWTGTAQGRLNGGTYGASGITITGWTAGTNLNVEFNTGTVGSVQLEKGSTATSFDYRPYGTELALCQRYHVGGANTSTSVESGPNYKLFLSALSVSVGSTVRVQLPMKVTMRATPTLQTSNNSQLGKGYFNGSGASLSLMQANSEYCSVLGTSVGTGGFDLDFYYALDAEL